MENGVLICSICQLLKIFWMQSYLYGSSMSNVMYNNAWKVKFIYTININIINNKSKVNDFVLVCGITRYDWAA